MSLLEHIQQEKQDTLGIPKNRIYNICNLLKKYVDNLSPITRQRYKSVKHDGVKPVDPAFLLEGENISFLKDKYKGIGGGVHPKELSDDQQSQSIILDNVEVDHDDPIEEITAFQHASNIGFSNVVSKRHFLTTCGPHRTNNHQILTIYKNCEARLSVVNVRPNYAYLFIALSIVYARTPEHLSNLKYAKNIIGDDEFWLLDKGTIYLAYRPDIPHKTLPKAKKGQNPTEKEALYYTTKSEH